MKNTYVTGYLPLIAIILYSMAFGIYAETEIIRLLKKFGLYSGMLEFFSENGIKLTLFFLASLLFFMFFSALKLIADTMIQLSMLFFSKDRQGAVLNEIRFGSLFYVLSGMLSLLFVNDIVVMVVLFLVTTLAYFIYFVYKTYSTLPLTGLVGMVFFHVAFWFAFMLTIVYVCIKLYNGFLESLPL
ncbi:hypothetical protein B0I26_10998 [Anoxybacillus vitaminiphilus]|uniref:YufK family protein n=1 Tax=Paranoxybacillus vitaminiphilus TaxID=581036 RepID=A0A327YDV2_9BACL|nr:DUF5366 family protein [Anoxybacillus vitaminiphilus]RAK18677.1 hypothetical protein B0I26_10998 [Anoxybacillus vitaminiphilus]